MRYVIVVGIDEDHLRYIDAIVDAGLYSSRSVFVRECVKKGIQKIRKMETK